MAGLRTKADYSNIFYSKTFSQQKKTANNIFKSHKKHKNIQNIPVFVKVSS